MTALCPHCGAAHDVAARFTGEAVFCRCGGWFRMGGVQLVACEAPVVWPKERRKA